MARIYDNIETTFTDGLNDIITNVGVKRVDFCVGYFNLRGWNIIVDKIDDLEGEIIYEGDEQKQRYCRLLIGMHRPPEDLVRELYSGNRSIPDADYVRRCKAKIALDFRRQLQLGIPTKNDEETLRHLSSQMKEGKVCVKLYLREPLHAKLYLSHRPDDNFNPIQAIMGSSNLTYAGLNGQGELNAEFGDSDSAQKLANWFNERWEDKFCLDITQELIEAIDTSWAGMDIPPYYIYLKTAYHLCQDARAGMKEFTLTPEFKRDLFDFQQTAVKIAAKHINNDKRGGAMIGDVVGLGKTITACAIIKLFEQAYGSSTLIICPANLQEMWKEKYVKKYDLKADVMSMSKAFDVDSMRYYRLVVIDESHNLRNSDGQRYQRIRELIHHQGCKVLLLTATPYNKDFVDLSNQLRLFLSDDQDLGIRPENYIRNLGGDRVFLQQHNETPIRSIKAFEKSGFVEDWNELMKLFLVRRTRTFVKDNYAKTDKASGRKYLEFNDGSTSYFPDRIPHSLRFPTIEGDQYSRLYSGEMLDLMTELRLPRYGLSQFIDAKKAEEAQRYERQILDNLSRAGARMMGFCRSTFFKRMDSSGYAFLLTLYRHMLRNMMFIYAIDNKLPLPIGDENTLPEDYSEDNDSTNLFTQDGQEDENLELLDISFKMEDYTKKAKNYYNMVAGKKNVAWINSQYFKRTLKQQLKSDSEVILKMMNLCQKWDAQADQKLNELEHLLTQIHPTEKVLVFTQYSDTAYYVYSQLKSRGINNIDYVTGGCKNPTARVERFSPISNGAEAPIPTNEQTRVMIATDVLSEGHNLQDAHIIVNYDLPWAIIRLIQRAGRVDRIGQKSTTIDCYSFFPADGVEEVIGLRQRLNDRINQNADVVGSDEIFFEGNEQNLRDLYNEKNGALDDDDDADVDLSSQAYQIWKNATDANPKLKEIIPSLSNIVYSTKHTDNASEAGVITYARTHNDFDVLTWVDTEGNIITQSQKRILQSMACAATEPAITPLGNHHDLVRSAIDSISEESTTNVGGILGNRFSTRYRIIRLLEDFNQQDTNLFFSADNKKLLSLSIDQIYNNQLTENAKFLLGRLLRTATDTDIVETVIEMYKDEKLCLINKDKNESKEPSIICSMGIRNE